MQSVTMKFNHLMMIGQEPMGGGMVNNDGTCKPPPK